MQPSLVPSYLYDFVDECSSAVERDALGSSDSVAVLGAGYYSFSSQLVGTCDESFYSNSPAIWYKLDGTFTGPNIIASAEACETFFELQLTIFSGDCDQLTCVAGTSDFCRRDVRWEWELGVSTYYLMFHGFGALPGGSFVFNVDSQ